MGCGIKRIIKFNKAIQSVSVKIFDNVKQDITNYFEKLKVGGIIAGHDYDVSERITHIKGVKKAVDEFFGKEPLKIYSDNSWVYIKEK